MARLLSSITVTERSGNAFPEERPDEGSGGELETNLMDALSRKKNSLMETPAASRDQTEETFSVSSVAIIQVFVADL